MIKLFLSAQLALLVIEVIPGYDAFGRQAALAITNLSAMVGVLVLHFFLQRRAMKLSVLTIVLVGAAVWLDALGNFQHYYAAFWWYDRLTHAVGGLAVTGLFIDLALNYQSIGRWFRGWWPAVWFGFLLGQFAAAMYEVSEWLGDWWFGTERVRGLFDAPRDLLFNLIGGLVVVGLLVVQKKRAGRL